MFQWHVIHVNVRDLMIRYSKDFARPAIEQFQAKIFFYREPALLPETGDSNEPASPRS
jgi:hypothetical protein